ncbi:MAG: Lrp/AsnC family transcriptional regulator [Nanoarchaeota archaeon]|nr:Lrp/AsnC family transcriptional regulator [Nanoarchaeota archaeon]
MEEFFENEPSITWAAIGIGSWNLVVTILAKDAEEFHKTSTKLFNQCENLNSHANFIATEAYTLPNQYLYQDIPEKLQKTTYLSQKDDPMDFEEDDIKILRELSENARITNTELSQKLDLKIGKISYRIGKLEKEGVIQAYKPMLNVQKLGRHTHIILLKINYKNQEQEKELLDHIQSLKCTKYIEKGIGRWDLAVALHQKNMAHFNQIINNLREKFKQTINMFETMLILKEYKCHFIPKHAS